MIRAGRDRGDGKEGKRWEGFAITAKDGADRAGGLMRRRERKQGKGKKKDKEKEKEEGKNGC